MDEQRALLDQLMGKDRNKPPEERKARHFTDSDVCKHYLCGVCPYDLFENTKSDLGAHPNKEVHDEEAKGQWDRLTQDEKDRYGYEHDLWELLESLTRQCDKRIERNKERAAQENQYSEEDVKKIVTLDSQIQQFTTESEQAAEEGEIDRAQELMSQVEELRKLKQSIEEGPRSKQIMVCEVSGNFISSRDNDERIQAHFQGKMYQGWKIVREKLVVFRDHPPPTVGSRRRDNGPARNERSRSGDRRRQRSNSRSRRRRRDDSRDRDRYRGRRRSNSRSRRGGRSRSRS